MRVRVLTAKTALGLAAFAVAGCTTSVAGKPHADATATLSASPSPQNTDVTGQRPTTTSTGVNLPPIGLSLEGLLVDPDPKTAGPASGTVTIARMTDKKMLSGADIRCLQDNDFLVGFAKDTSSTTPAQTVWAFQLSSNSGATNCAVQMRRSDESVATLTDVATTFGLSDVTAYCGEVTADSQQLAFCRALYIAGNRLFRVTVSQPKVSHTTLEGTFRDLLTKQLQLAPPGSD